MKVAVIGGGFTGLAAAYELLKNGHKVTIFEKEKNLGGLAIGWKEPHWQWHLEKAYHHWFTNDDSVRNLIDELGLSKKLIVKRPITAVWWSAKGGSALGGKNQMYPFDSPSSLISFPGLSFTDKIRTAFLLGGMKLNPFWQPLESITAEQLCRSIGGEGAWRTIWEPLLYGKFGDFADKVNAAWFWARIKKRTPSLMYMEGGFQTLVDRLSEVIRDHGGMIYTNTAIDSIKKGVRGQYYVLWKKQKDVFDRVLLTIPTPFAVKLFPLIPNTYTDPLLSIPHLHAQTLILETDQPILKNVYWLNVTDRSFPFLAVVAHTNFMDKKYYGGHHITYIGNYLPTGHPYLSMTKEQLLKKFDPFIKKFNPSYHISLITSHLFTGPFAQPIHELNYSKKIPSIKTPNPHIFLANMDYIYPWDRGTNYAVELGIKAARIIHENS